MKIQLRYKLCKCNYYFIYKHCRVYSFSFKKGYTEAQSLEHATFCQVLDPHNVIGWDISWGFQLTLRLREKQADFNVDYQLIWDRKS